MRTLILSDIHLGSRNCQAAQLAAFLDSQSFDRIVLNGDTINSVNLKKFNPAHWAILNRFKKLARSRELILVRGNHDHDYDHVPAHVLDNGHSNGFAMGSHLILPSLLEVPMIEEYMLKIGGQKYLITHGDRFDPSLCFPIVTEMADWCYRVSQKVNKKLAKWLKKKSKRWGGLLEYIRLQSVAYARSRGVDGIIMGHTHFADDVHLEGIHYLNSGTWTELPSTYVMVEDDDIQLGHVQDEDKRLIGR